MILAKSREKGEITLRRHIEDLLTQSENLFSAFPELDKEDLKEMLKLSIILHDLGKILPWYQWQFENPGRQKNPHKYIPHSLFSLFWIDINKLFSELKEKDSKLVLTAIAFHHWREKFSQLLLKENEDLKSVLRTLVENADLRERLETNLKDQLKEQADYIKFNRELAQGVINGLSLLDTNLIPPPYLTYFLPQRLGIPEEDKRRQVLISGLLQRVDNFASFLEEENLKEKIEGENIPYENIKENVIREIRGKREELNLPQGDIWQLEKLEKVGSDRNLILVAPTGYGKTDFAFLWAGGKKLLYTLPIRVAVNQIFEKAKKIFTGEKSGVLHSDADLYLLKEREQKDYEDALRTYEVAKHLSYPTIIATGDQFFPSALKYPTYEKIYVTLSYSNLVIDEVQAYNPEACAIIVKLIEDVNRLGGKFLLMTATLPEFVEKEIEKRLGDGSFSKINLYAEEQNKLRKNKRHLVKFKLLEGKPEGLGEELIDEIVKKSKDGGKRVLVIANTIGMAQKIYEKLGNDVPKQLIHSRFAQFHRQEKEENIVEREFKSPKPESEKEPKILVSTQVVEASLNIDADHLFTELAPLDALVQRMGRVWRRKRAEEEFDYSQEYKDENVTILVWKDGLESGKGEVYDEELLVATLMILSSKEELKDEYWLKGGKKRKRVIEELLDAARNKPPFSLSEYEKQEKVKKLYEILPRESKYLQNFYTTLDILDAGYVSEKKGEAEKVFRKIYDINVVIKKDLESLKEEIENFFSEHKELPKWRLFKEKIISKFVIPTPIRRGLKTSPCYASLEEKLLQVKPEKNKEKLKRWLQGIYVVEAEYDKDFGLKFKEQEKNDSIL